MDPLRVLFVSPHTVFPNFESLLNAFVSLNSKKTSNFIWNEFFWNEMESSRVAKVTLFQTSKVSWLSSIKHCTIVIYS
jgi:hypothetical protein